MTNYKIEVVLVGEDVVKLIKAQRISWYEHISRREESSTLRKISGKQAE